MDLILDALLDALIDGLKLLPFLYLTYLLMEWLENKTSDRTKQMLRRSGRVGPLLGGALGVVPQCGFSAAASNLYAGRVITVGTLLAVYLSTSDEMVPIFLSEMDKISAASIVKILFLKMAIGIAAGFFVDFIVWRRDALLKMKKNTDPRMNNPFQIKELCEQEHCHCQSSTKGMFLSALRHTMQVWGFIFAISFGLNVLVELIGVENVGSFALKESLWGILIAGIIGLIPNCAASVLITQLYLEGALGFGAMMAGLLVGAGVGLLVLFRVQLDVRKNIKIVGLLYGIGVFAGILLQVLGIGKLI